MIGNTLYLSHFETPLGRMTACSTHLGICMLVFSDTENSTSTLKQQEVFNPQNIIHGENEHLFSLKAQLSEYFDGKRRSFELNLNPEGTEFQQKVWDELLNISFGATRSYLQQAEALKNVKAIRAVAAANASNPIAIVIPCHRVIGSDGSLTGYAGGISKKKWLLDHEQQYRQITMNF